MNSRKNFLWILPIIIAVPFFLLGMHADLMIVHQKEPVITIGYTRDKESLFLAYISQESLKRNGLLSILHQVDPNDSYYGLDSVVDFMILPLSSYQHLGITSREISSLSFAQFYRLYSSYWPEGVEVGDPAEADLIYKNTFSSNVADHILVPIFQSSIYSPELANTLGFLTGELSSVEITRDLQQYPKISAPILAKKWWNIHAFTKN